MKFTKSSVISTAIVAFLILGLFVGGAYAAYPEKGKAIHLYIGYGTGGGTDRSARTLAEFLEKELDATIVPENYSGASGMKMISRLIKAKPDGYTIALTPIPATNMHYLDTERGATYTLADITPICIHDYSVQMIATAADSKWKSFRQMLDSAKANPNSVSSGSNGVLGLGHLTVLLISQNTGIEFNWMNFEKPGMMRASVLGKHIDFETSGVSEVIDPAKNGTLRLLAYMGEERHSDFPDVPTAREQCLDQVGLTTRVVVGPKGLPANIVKKLESAILKLHKDAKYQAVTKKRGIQLNYKDSAGAYALWKQFDKDYMPILKSYRSKK